MSLPKHEFLGRVDRVREAMQRRGLDGLLVFSYRRAHVTYLSGYRPNYHTNCAALLLSLKSEPVLWIKFSFDLPRARKASWIEDIRGSTSDDVLRMVAQCTHEITSRNLGRSQLGLVGSDLAVDEITFSMRQFLCQQLPAVQWQDASDLLNEIRLIKSDTEIAALRDAAALGELAGQRFCEKIRPGVKDRDATVAGENAARLDGAEECSIILSTDPGRMTLPACGYEFRDGDIVACDISVQYRGYWVQVCRVFSIGEPRPEQQQVFDVCRKSYEAGLEAAKAGQTVAQMVHCAQRMVDEAGYGKCLQYGAGHGVGLDLPELYPLQADCEGRLRSGMVLVLHPNVWVPGRGCAFLGGPIAVSETRSVPLDHPQLEIVKIRPGIQVAVQ